MSTKNFSGISFRFGICLIFLLALPTAWSASVDGQSLFEKRCAACHQLPDINKPPPEGWEKRLQLMAPLAKLKSNQKAAVLEYLSAHVEESIMSASLAEDKAFFEKKCSQCHTLDRIFLEPLTDESRLHVVNRMQARSGTDLLSDEDVERILNYLSNTIFEVPTPPNVTDGADGKELFAIRCQACHTMERISFHLGKDHAMKMDWSHIVNRMRGKAPQWMTDDESIKIAQYLQSLNIPENYD